MKKRIVLLTLGIISIASLHAQDQKMNAFITALMSKMTVDEKIGQLQPIHKIFQQSHSSKWRNSG